MFALDIETLNIKGDFTGKNAQQEMKGHILASSSHVGTYSMSPANHNLQKAVLEAEDAILTM
jgi:hypothetical protein